MPIRRCRRRATPPPPPPRFHYRHVYALPATHRDCRHAARETAAHHRMERRCLRAPLQPIFEGSAVIVTYRDMASCRAMIVTTSPPATIFRQPSLPSSYAIATTYRPRAPANRAPRSRRRFPPAPRRPPAARRSLIPLSSQDMKARPSSPRSRPMEATASMRHVDVCTAVTQRCQRRHVEQRRATAPFMARKRRYTGRAIRR